MATVFKTLNNNDTVNTRTLLHEAIPLTGSIVSGTYNDENIKTFSHGMFQSVYDYPYLSSSANHIFDITVGYASLSPLSASTSVQNAKKINIYNQMAGVLVGHDITGSIMRFDKDGDLTGGEKMDSCIFLNFSRLLTKDEIKKGSFSMSFITGGVYSSVTGAAADLTIVDTNVTNGQAAEPNGYKVNSPAGEYGILSSSLRGACGLIYYQAGVVVLTASIFSSGSTGTGGTFATTASLGTGSAMSLDSVLTGSNISYMCDSFRSRLVNLQFNNTTELNSTVYFCRANHNDFNYSANPSYLSGSKMRVKQQALDEPVSYITSVGLYSADNELLAVAKLSEPLKKTPNNEVTLRVRLDY